MTDLQRALDLAEEVRNQLWGAARTLAALVLSPEADTEGHQPDTKDLEALTTQWAIERDYWSQLEIPFYDVLECLPDDLDQTLLSWRETLQRTAWRAFDRVADNLAQDVTRLKATVRAREQLAAGLGKVLKIEETAVAKA